MPTFQYTAINAAGQSEHGQVAASSRYDVLAQLQKRALTPTQLREVESRKNHTRPVPRHALIQVYTGIADLLESGVPLLKTVEVVAGQVRNKTISQALNEVRQQIADGETLANALRSQSQIFDDLTINVIAVGEEGGFLEQSLQRIAQLTQRQAELRSRLIGALVYPIFLLSVGIIVSLGMFLFFVPIFEPLFERMSERGELPWITSALLTTSTQARTLVLPIVCTAAAFAYLVSQSLKSDKTRGWLDGLQLKLAGIGPVLCDLTLSRFADLLGSLLSNGVPLIRALELTERTLTNRQLSNVISQARVAVAGGGSLAAVFSTNQFIPAEFAETIGIAEQSNRLDSVLSQLSNRLEVRAQRKLEVLTKMLEPILMTFLAAAIGFLIIALLLPIFTSSGKF